MDSKRPEKFLETNKTLYIKFLKSKSSEDELVKTNYKSIFKELRKKSKESCYSNLLEKHKVSTTQ